MERRELIRKLLLGLPAGLVIPSILESCKKADLLGEEINFSGKVIIIGAGAAGIYAAALLEEYGIDYEILEADVVAGGRIKTNNTFSDVPLELGADVIDGQRSVFYDMLRQVAPSALERNDLTEYFWYTNQLRTENYLRTAADLAGEGETLFQLIESLGTYPGKNQNLNQYIIDFPIDSKLLNIANALIGNSYGADNDRVGMLALREAESLASAGSQKFYLNEGSLLEAFADSFPEAYSKINYSQVVSSINYTSSDVIVTTAGGETFSGQKVIVTVPITILKQGLINFNPALSISKSNAISKIGMGNIIKVILKFNAPFWAEDTSRILGGSIVPEYKITNAGKNSTDFLVTALVAGESATALLQLPENQMINSMLSELNSFYPSGNVPGKYSGDYFIHDWSQEPYIKGGYSFPSIDSAGQREIFAEPIADKVYFAGEAANINGHIGTVHGAMETSYITISKILKG